MDVTSIRTFHWSNVSQKQPKDIEPNLHRSELQ